VSTTPKVLIRLPEVLKYNPVAKPTLYGQMKAGKFPRPINLGGRAVAWDLDLILRWQEERIKASAEEAK
jgi:prophage regulatory protein